MNRDTIIILLSVAVTLSAGVLAYIITMARADYKARKRRRALEEALEVYQADCARPNFDFALLSQQSVGGEK